MNCTAPPAEICQGMRFLNVNIEQQTYTHHFISSENPLYFTQTFIDRDLQKQCRKFTNDNATSYKHTHTLTLTHTQNLRHYVFI